MILNNNNATSLLSGLQALYKTLTPGIVRLTSNHDDNCNSWIELDLNHDTPQEIEYQQINVIEDQPLLKIKSSSLLHGAVMLFEGEM